LLESNVSHRLRSSAQFKAEVLAAHLEIARGDAVFDNALHTVQLKPRQQSEPRLRAKMAQADRDESIAFACVQSLELASPGMQDEIIAWLRRHVGEPI
jgi:Tfp pilus assembly protein FimT